MNIFPGVVNQRVASNVKRLRKLRHMQQLDLAAKMTADGVPMRNGTISKLENSDRAISVDELAALAKALGVSPLDLLCEPQYRCDQCQDQAPRGYTCNACGRTR